VDVGFMNRGQMGKTQHKNDFNTGTGQEMQREVRASLNSVSDLILSARKRKT
jgi:hypothetical protein